MPARAGALPTGGIRYFRRYLLPQTETESDFSGGMVRNRARHAIPASGSYQLTDFFIDKPGMMYKRGGSAYQSDTLNDHSDVDIVAIGAIEFTGYPTVLAITSNGSTGRFLYDITSGTHVNTGSVSGFQPIENLTTLYNNKLLLTSGTLSPPVAPMRITKTAGTLAVAAWGGSPPAAIYSCVHDGRIVLGNTAAHPNWLFHDPPSGEEDTWEPAINYFQTDYPITGLCSVNSTLLVFSRGHCQRIIGDIPTGVKDGNWQLQPGGNVGCIDARTIVVMNGECYYANESGVYKTANGSGFDEISAPIRPLWQSTLAGFSPALGAVVCAGAYLNQFLLLSVLHNSGVRTSFLYHTTTGSWVQLSDKVSATMYATSFAPTTELYIGPADTALWTPPRAQALSGFWTPTSSNKNDAPGTAVVPIWESRPYRPGVGLGRYVYAHLSYDMRDAASDNPTLAASQAAGLEAPTYTAVAESPLAETTDAVRKRLTPFKDSQALSMKFTQANASAKTEIYQLELEQAAYFVADGQ